MSVTVEAGSENCADLRKGWGAQGVVPNDFEMLLVAIKTQHKIVDPMILAQLTERADVAGICATLPTGGSLGGMVMLRYLEKNSSKQLKKACLSSGDKFIQLICSTPETVWRVGGWGFVCDGTFGRVPLGMIGGGREDVARFGGEGDESSETLLGPLE